LLGLAAVLHTSAVLFQVVKFAGVAYLLWLAWQALKSGGALAIAPGRPAASGAQIARRGALINILNPKLSLFFLALLPPFLSGTPATATAEMLALGAVFMGLTLVVFALYGSFAAAARDTLLSSERAMRWLNRSFAAIFAALGARLALERV
jgi:threonine/homoserine/homoserine lactone efflux protein